MKISIDLFGELLLELSLVRSPSGQWLLRGMFPTFVDRPKRPHVTVLAEDGLDIHFTAGHGRADVYRRKLAKVGVARIEAFSKRATLELVRLQAESLRPADLQALTAAGWIAHFADRRIVSRWLAGACQRGAALRLDEESVTSFVLHVCRHSLPPTDLVSVEGHQFFPLMRWKDDDIEVRTLFHYPEGVWIPGSGDELTRIAPAGWYWAPTNWMTDEETARVVPAEQLARIAQKLERYLGRFPRRTPAKGMGDVPKFAGWVWGYYLSALLDLVVELKAKAEDVKRGIG